MLPFTFLGSAGLGDRRSGSGRGGKPCTAVKQKAEFLQADPYALPASDVNLPVTQG